MAANGPAPGTSRRTLPAISHREQRRARGFRRAAARALYAPERPAPGGGKAHPVVLEVKNLRTYFFTYEGVVRALDGINLRIRGGETAGIVGETGCGKSVTAFSVNRLISDPGRVVSGEIRFQSADLLWGLDREAKFRRIRGSDRIKVIRSFRRIRAANERLAAMRGRKIAMIFQEPMTAMNPVFTVANQLGEPLLIHRGVEVIDHMLAADSKLRGRTEIPEEEGRDEMRPARRKTTGTGLEVLDDWRHAAPAGAPQAAAEPAAAPEPREEGNPYAVAIDELLAAVGTTPDQLRTAAKRLGEVFGMPSVGTQVYYLLKNASPGPDYRPRVLRALRRVELSGLARGYLRLRRRLTDLTLQESDAYIREMTVGKSQRVARSAIRTRMLAARLRRLHFRIPGLARAGKRALDQEVLWRVVQMLEGVQIANPVTVAKAYPHELSGGMLQRVMIAMALVCDPALLLADEPTTALDVTIQAQVLELIHSLRERVGTAIVLITHDLGVVAEVCDRVNVMYAGRIVEAAPASELFRRPLHPYTQGLLSSIPRFDQPDKELQSIPGSVPNLIHPPPGCRFHPRCPYAMKVCKTLLPVESQLGDDHMVACHLYQAHEDEALQEPVEAPLPSALPLPAAAQPASA